MLYYAFAKGHFSQTERAFIAECLADARGWVSKYPIRHTTTKSCLRKNDKLVILHLTRDMRAHFPKEFANFSVCDRRSHPYHIHINEKNWYNVPALFTGNRRTYRQYVIQHEVGHALGYDHAPAVTDGARCHVMQQQTRGTTQCKPNPWITLLDQEYKI